MIRMRTDSRCQRRTPRAWSGGRPRTNRSRDRPQGWPQLLERSRHRLNDLEIRVPQPFDLDAFAAEVQRVRGGRPLELVGFRVIQSGVSHCGYTLLFPGRPYDRICFQHGLSDRGSVHNAVHELAHLIWGHRGVTSTVNALPDAEITSQQGDEDAADALAAVVLGQWGPEPASRGQSSSPARALAAARLHEAFG